MELESAFGLLGKSNELLLELYQRHKELQGLEDEIYCIDNDLLSIKEAIKRNSGMEDQDGSRSWLANLRNIRDKIQDCLDLYELKITSEHNQGPKLIRRLHIAAHHIKTLPDCANILEEIRKIRKLSTEAKARQNNYHPQQSDHDQATATQQAGQASAAQSNTSVEAQPKGLETPIRKLVEMLKDGDGNAKQLTVIAIAGLGGSGKSVLAHAAYNQVREEFRKKQHLARITKQKQLTRTRAFSSRASSPQNSH